MSDYPAGNGDPHCKVCRGRGVVPVEIDGWPGASTQNCLCVFARDLRANVKRIWPVLLEAGSVEESPLLALTERNLWITASNFDLRQHLRHTAFRMGPSWYCKVSSDAALMTAWLSTAKEVFDADVLIDRNDPDRPRINPSDKYQTIVDLVVPLDLLILRLGVKAAKNREMANVLVEAVQERMHVGRPTWIVDSPVKPLIEGHRCYSGEIMELVESFDRIRLTLDSTVHRGEHHEPVRAKSLPVGVQPAHSPPPFDDGGVGGYHTKEERMAAEKREKQAKRRKSRNR